MSIIIKSLYSIKITLKMSKHERFLLQKWLTAEFKKINSNFYVTMLNTKEFNNNKNLKYVFDKFLIISQNVSRNQI